jgi:hypothetical protein
MKSPLLIATIALSATLAGCVVAPPRAVYVAPAGVAYIAPTYAMPGPGYVWQYHAHYGWGWRHPRNGWHRGWR